MASNKNYLISILIKKMGIETLMSNSLNNLFTMLKNTYPYVSDSDYKEIEHLYNIEKYIEKITALFDEHFSEEEIRDIIKFYSSPHGSRLINSEFASNIKSINNTMASNLETEFIERNGRNRQTSKRN